MGIKIFLDTNIIISGIYFNENEAELLDKKYINFCISDTIIKELYDFIKTRYKKVGHKTKEEAEYYLKSALIDIETIITIEQYKKYILYAERLIKHKNDINILTAGLFLKPEYFVTGNKHFHAKEIKKELNVVYTRDLLKFI